MILGKLNCKIHLSQPIINLIGSWDIVIIYWHIFLNQLIYEMGIFSYFPTNYLLGHELFFVGPLF
jgi:hypothetical protein